MKHVGKTISELFADGVRRVTRSPWNEFAHIELIESQGHLVAYARLHDISAGYGLGDPMPVLLFSIGANESVWRAWAPTARMKSNPNFTHVDWREYEAAP